MRYGWRGVLVFSCMLTRGIGMPKVDLINNRWNLEEGRWQPPQPRPPPPCEEFYIGDCFAEDDCEHVICGELHESFLKDVRDEHAQHEVAGCGELRMGICLKNLQGEEAQGELTKADLDGVLASLRRIRVAAESCLEDLRGDEGRFTTTSWQVTSEVLSMNSKLHGAGGDEGRSTGLQVPSEVWSMSSELQAAGGNEGRITITDLQVASEVLSINSELQGAGGDRIMEHTAPATFAQSKLALRRRAAHAQTEQHGLESLMQVSAVPATFVQSEWVLWGLVL